MNSAFWNGKKVFLTGHTGFKGSWLSLWLQKVGTHVVGYALAPPTHPSLFDGARVADGMTSIVGDIRNFGDLRKALTLHRPEIVIHMAAQALVGRSYEEPIETYTTNVIGTVNVLEAVRNLDDIRVVVSITSDKCYENKEWQWGYRENDCLGGDDPYSSSKSCAELVINSYRKSYFCPRKDGRKGTVLASCRAGNVSGGGDWAKDRLIPDIMRAMMDDRTVSIRRPHAIRPWQHVLEPLHGYLSVAEKLWFHGHEYAQAWNFGPDQEDGKPVSWIADYITASWGKENGWELDSDHYPEENNYLKLDCSRARNLLGWAPKLSVAKSLDWVVEWYRDYYRSGDMRSLTVEQINRFEKI